MLKLTQTPKNICIFRLSAIGDVCNAVPFLRTLQTAFPQAKITWVIGKVEYDLLEDIQGVEFIVYDKKLGRQANKQLKQSLTGRKFDILFMLQAALRASMASLAIKADIKLGFDKARAKDFQWLFSNERIAAKEKRHVLDGFFDFLVEIGITQRVLEWNIPIRSENKNFAQDIVKDKKTALISPCSSDRKNNFRNWSVANYAALCDDLIATGKQVILTGAPTEREMSYAKSIEAAVENGAKDSLLLNLSGKTNLKQLFALISEVDCVIAPDSGPLHMANAAGTHCIGLFASSNTFRTGPYKYQHLVVNKYPKAAKKYLDKKVEQLKWGQRVRHPDVMDLIELKDVQEKLKLID